jgi:beta-galactosidase/beta-glucuronidase
MASTRNKNTPGNYCLDQKQYTDSSAWLLNVNGAKLWARGANLIPMDEMEGRNSREAYFYMLKSAADAKYNILRIWGGGVFFPEYVIETCVCN